MKHLNLNLTRSLASASAVFAAATLLSLSPAFADENEKKGDAKHDHDHDHSATAGPNGGKVLHEVDPHAELFVTKDRKLQITFIDHHNKVLAPGTQTVSVICGKRSAPTRMKFEKKDNALLSDKALPEGMNIPTVLQIKMTPDSKSVMVRLNLNLEDCPTCDHLEYACTCDHHHDHDHDHDEKK